MDKVVMVKLAKLVEDFDLYPRPMVDSTRVKRLKEAMEAGEDLPPIVVDKDSFRIVDGFHRNRAALAVHGPDGSISCILKSYPDKATMFEDAARLNSRHGEPLGPNDRAHCLLRAEGLGLSVVRLAAALAITEARLVAMRPGHFALVKGEGEVPLKPGMRRFHGRTLTPRQAILNKHLVGQNAIYYLRMATDFIESKSLDLTDERIVGQLVALEAALAKMKPRLRKTA
jgi:ParB-like chromosome segregation protein Spo0J